MHAGLSTWIWKKEDYRISEGNTLCHGEGTQKTAEYHKLFFFQIFDFYSNGIEYMDLDERRLLNCRLEYFMQILAFTESRIDWNFSVKRHFLVYR